MGRKEFSELVDFYRSLLIQNCFTTVADGLKTGGALLIVLGVMACADELDEKSAMREKASQEEQPDLGNPVPVDDLAEFIQKVNRIELKTDVETVLEELGPPFSDGNYFSKGPHPRKFLGRYVIYYPMGMGNPRIANNNDPALLLKFDKENRLVGVFPWELSGVTARE